jgi:hypothetical protein
VVDAGAALDEVVHALHGFALDGQAEGRVALLIQVIDQLDKKNNKNMMH